jgi:hypothetical protein
VTISKETVGFNIFKPSAYDGPGVGYGTSFDGEIQPNKNGKYILTFDLGVSKENPQVPLEFHQKNS